MDQAVVVGAQVASGLLAGVYLAFSIAVMPALRGTDDDAFVDVMNRINRAILNPAFLLLFFGTPVLTIASLAWHRDGAAWVAAVTAVLALVQTIALHVPMNEALAAGGSRGAFENRWTTWHVVRTALCVATFTAALAVD